MRLNVQCLGFFLIASVLLFTTSIIQINAEDESSTKQQTSQEISTDDIVCKERLEVVWKYDGMPTCVKPDSVLKLVKSGWISHETIDRISILDKRIHKVYENVYAFQFNYCAAVYNENALGIIVSSDTEKIPVQIDPNIQTHQCQQYGTQIHASSDSSLEVSLFYEKDMQTLFKRFDKKKMNLEDDLVSYQQRLLRLEDPNLDENNLEKIDQVKIRIELINHVIQSYKQGLNTFRALQ